MKLFRRLTSLLLCLLLVFGMAAGCFAANNYSSWFEPNYKEIQNLGLLPSSFSGLDLTKPITRGEMADLAVQAFEKATGNGIEVERTDYFSDTTDANIIKASEYGIVSGYPDGTYRPGNPLTRQEFFKIVENFCTSGAFNPSASNGSLSGFSDAASVSDWAKNAALICVGYGFVQGSSSGSSVKLNPTSTTSREEAMTIFLRCYKKLKEYYHELVVSASVVVDESELNVTVTDASKTMYVTASTLNVRDSWTSSSTKVGTLSFGDKVSVTGVCSNGWFRIHYKSFTAYVSGDYLSDQAASKPSESGNSSGSSGSSGSTGGSGLAAEIAEFAMSFVGYSYVWAGASPSTGFDCSGLMYYCLTQYGYSMNRTADDQMKQGSSVSRDELAVGDLVFFGYSGYANHVGMYIGNGNFVHASTPSTGVRINSLDETYYKTRYIGARRII